MSNSHQEVQQLRCHRIPLLHGLSSNIFDHCNVRYRWAILPLLAILASCWGVAVMARADNEISFVDWSERIGLSYQGQTWGASWRDLDDDGFVDLFVSHHFTYPKPFKFAPIIQTPAAIYVNDHAQCFVDHGRDLLGKTPGDWHGASWADLNNDGRADLLVARGGNSGLLRSGPITDNDRLLNTNLLFMQSVDGFVEQGEARGLALPWQRGRRPVLFDIDLDGRLDVIFAQAEADPADIIYLQDQQGHFSACPEALPGISTTESAGVAFVFRGFDSGERHLQFSGAPGKLYRQTKRHGCSFEEVLPDVNLGARHTMDLLLADLTNDLSLDYFGPTKAGGSFIRQTSPQVISVGLAGMDSLERLDFRVEGDAMVIIRPASGLNNWTNPNDQHTFLGASGVAPTGYQFQLDPNDTRFHGAFPSTIHGHGVHIWFDPATSHWSMTVKKSSQAPFFLELIGTERLEIVGELPPLPAISEGASDVLYVQGPKTWRRIPGDYGLGGVATSCVSAVAADFDNDGDIDVFLGCADDQGSRPYLMYENLGDRLELRTVQLPPETYRKGLIDSVSSADFDNDGFMDVFVTRGQGEIMSAHGGLTLLHNSGNENNWVKVKLIGVQNSRDAFGARVFVRTSEQTQLGYASGGVRMTAQDDATLHFGLGQHTMIDMLLVEWPNGHIENFVAPGVNQRFDLKEGTGTPLNQPIILTAKASVFANREVRFLLLTPEPIPPESVVWTVDGDVMSHGGLAFVHSFDTIGSHVVSAQLSPDDRRLQPAGLIVRVEAM
jgi:hypothetical protein